MIRPMHMALVALALLVTLARPGIASAQVETAKQLSENARQQYSIGNFKDALTLYKQSYQVAPLPVTIFNVAQCHRQLGQLEQALFLYKSYLRQSPQAPNRGTVENLIADLESQVERRRASGAVSAPVDERSLLPQKDVAPTAAAVTASTSSEADEAPRWYRRWYIWAGIGAVVVGAVVGGVLGARAASSSPSDPNVSNGTMTFDFGRR